MSFVVKVVCG
ncbi:hypothetical protein L8S09_18930 [Vibrio aestuarianus]|nr:hypothetical protein [Vibrio aestuarianus]MDE1229369.1 hypothetical protein [Vibrio aestuarianus]MDE1259109.1 hypothetical protein [Vibrio aestuarianus]MDE1273293.1 hypothetical protein [Vibrio aestuarianus]MDE1287203.1 hypothetical protein [Vibrio aestuarianus]